MHDIFKDALRGIASIGQPAPDPRELEAALSEIHLAKLERQRLQQRIAELESILARIAQRLKGKAQ